MTQIIGLIQPMFVSQCIPRGNQPVIIPLEIHFLSLNFSDFEKNAINRYCHTKLGCHKALRTIIP